MVAASPAQPESVVLADGVLYIHDLVETDAEVLRVVREADEALDATRQCLRIGARSVLAAHVNMDADIVEKRFDAMTDRFDERVELAVGRISEVAQTLLDEEDGSLTGAMAAHRQELDALLGATFDPDSKKSVIAILEQVLEEAREQQVGAIKRLVSVDGEDSPLAQVKHAILADVKAQLGDVRKDVQDLSERIAVNDAVAPVLELTTGKGFKFEDVLHSVVARIAAVHGDVADRVGAEYGVAGTQKGDEVVTLNLEDTHSLEARIVFEAKSRKLNMRKTLEELDDALENRDALAAVAVFTSSEQAPTSVAFHYTDNKAIVVLDKDGTDDHALRLAYMWARWVARRSLAGGATDEIDLERIAGVLDDARRAIERSTQIKRFHTQARKSIDQAAEHVGLMVDEVRDALDAVAEELAEYKDEGEPGRR